jgi:hypothetical protein
VVPWQTVVNGGPAPTGVQTVAPAVGAPVSVPTVVAKATVGMLPTSTLGLVLEARMMNTPEPDFVQVPSAPSGLPWLE